MSDLISREALLKDIEAAKEHGGMGAVVADTLTRYAKRQPSADAAPVVYGRWNDSFDGITPYCSVCSHSHRLMTRTPNYCPNCGARMDGKED